MHGGRFIGAACLVAMLAVIGVATFLLLVRAFRSVLLAATGSYDKLTDWAIFALWLFYGLTASTVIVLRRKMPHAERPYRVWGYPYVPAVFLLASAGIVVNALVTDPVNTGVTLLIIAVAVAPVPPPPTILTVGGYA